MNDPPMPLTAATIKGARSNSSNSSSSIESRDENDYREPAHVSRMTDVVIGRRSNIRQHRPELRIRRFGRSDFERFNEEKAVGDHTLLRRSSIGKVKIECKYRWKQARWGVLGPDQEPAGIVYIDISFKQPPGHALSNADILITLSEATPVRHGLFGRRRPIRTSLESENAVQVTEYFGPQALYGPPGISLETDERIFQPTIGAGGLVELGGMGTRQSVTRQYVDSWTFRGTHTTAKDGVGIRCLEWELTENDTERKPLHKHVFYTAFAFKHDGGAINMCVEIGGRLKSRTKQGKQRLFKFCSRSGGGDNVMVTQIDLSTARNDFKERLDQSAFDLDLDMERINHEARPVEMPGPTQAIYKPVASEAIPDAGKDTLSSLEKASVVGINELRDFLVQATTRPPAFKISQPECSGTSSSGDETLVNDSENTVSNESTASKQMAWRLPEIMVLALIRWLMLMLKALGTDDGNLAGITVSVAKGEKMTADHDVVIDRLKPEIQSRSGSRMEPVPKGKSLDAAATQSVSVEPLAPKPYGGRFGSHPKRGSHIRVSPQNAAT